MFFCGPKIKDYDLGDVQNNWDFFFGSRPWTNQFLTHRIHVFLLYMYLLINWSPPNIKYRKFCLLYIYLHINHSWKFTLVVVSNIFCFQCDPWGNDPIWRLRIFFKWVGKQPPTSYSGKLTAVPWKSMVGRCFISYWNSPFLGDIR